MEKRSNKQRKKNAAYKIEILEPAKELEPLPLLQFKTVSPVKQHLPKIR